MSEANRLNIRVHEFYPQPDPVMDSNGRDTGEIVVRDYVKYGPPHSMDRQATVARVERVLKAKRPVDGSKNVAEINAWLRAEYIGPLYAAWKKGEELPDEGVPLAACNFLRKDEVALLKTNAIRSVEELANVPDSVLDRIRIPGMREKRTQAKRFLEAQDTNKAAAQLAAQEARIRELEERLSALADKSDDDDAPKRRGRPPKVSYETSEAV